MYAPRNDRGNISSGTFQWRIHLQSARCSLAAATVGAGQTGQFAFTQTGSIDFTGATPPAIGDIVISQDVLASGQSFSGITIQTLTITGVHPGTVVNLTTNDLPPGYTLPPGFTLPQNVVGEVLNFSITTNSPFVSGSGSIALLGTLGSLDLLGHAHIVANVLGSLQTIDTGAAVLSFGTQTTGAVNELFTPAFTVACFASNTRIGAPDLDILVEHLREGDTVLSALGGTAKVQWVGHRTIDCRRHPKPESVWPVRVQAGAFGPGQPLRDLRLSPDHAVYADGVLVPVRYLVNGASIAQEQVDSITYWHVELPAHDVLLAEGLPAESYLDTGNRAAFANGGTTIMAHADFAPAEFARAVWDAEGCAPMVVDGPILAGLRQRLLDRAKTLGHARTGEPDIHIEISGRRIDPRREGDALVWDLPTGTAEIRLVSRSIVPAWTGGDAADHRRLGVAVASLTLDGNEVSSRTTGWHAPEAGWQWTDGNAAVATGAGRLELRIAVGAEYWDGSMRRAAA